MSSEIILERTYFSKALRKYIRYRKTTKPLSDKYLHLLKRFNDNCAATFPDAKHMTTEMLDILMEKRGSETHDSRQRRLIPVYQFLEYAMQNGLSGFEIHRQKAFFTKKTYMPYIFSADELKLLFDKADNLQQAFNEPDKNFRIKQLVISATYRLAYATGLRNKEIRCLKRKDVDLKNGIIHIKDSDGDEVRFVVLNDSVTDMLWKYDFSMKKLIPRREVFFPNKDGECFNDDLLMMYFRRIIKEIKDVRVRFIDLRCTYAVENIKSWDYQGTEWIDKLLYLSRAMGHAKLSSTCKYQQYVPHFHQTLSDISSENLQKLLPNITDFSKYEQEKEQ